MSFFDAKTQRRKDAKAGQINGRAFATLRLCVFALTLNLTLREDSLEHLDYGL